MLRNQSSRASSQSPNGEGSPLPSDREIAFGIANGQEWAADALYNRVHRVVDQSLRRILRAPGPDHDDLVQAAFERIITVLSKRALGGKCDLRAWSAAVTTHVALDALRRRDRERRLFQVGSELPPVPTGETGADVRVDARFEVGRLQRILTRMKPYAAETLLLHDVLGYELTEVAQITGVTVAAAQSRLVRSRKELLRRANIQLTERG